MKIVFLSLTLLLLYSSITEASSCRQIFKKDRFEEAITRKDFERELEELISEVQIPNHGFFGPQSMVWKIWKEEAINLRAASSIALQISHPIVAHAISAKPEGIQQPIKRYDATAAVLSDLIFGNLDTALRTSRRMHVLHSQFKGRTKEYGNYKANNPELIHWVWATLIEGSLQAYQRYVGPLTKHEVRQYYQESKILVQLSGVPKNVIPETYADFRVYFNKQVDQLVVTENAKIIFSYLLSREGIGRFIDEKIGPIAKLLGMNLAPKITAAMLPDRIAKELGLTKAPILTKLLEQTRFAVRITPPQLRYRKEFRRALDRVHR